MNSLLQFFERTTQNISKRKREFLSVYVFTFIYLPVYSHAPGFGIAAADHQSALQSAPAMKTVLLMFKLGEKKLADLTQCSSVHLCFKC